MKVETKQNTVQELHFVVELLCATLLRENRPPEASRSAVLVKCNINVTFDWLIHQSICRATEV